MFPLSPVPANTSSTNDHKLQISSSNLMASDTHIVIRSVAPQPYPLEFTMSEKNLAVKNMPFPGTMEFKDNQTAYWKAHTPPQFSSKIKKLGMLKKIAHDQEKSGLHFEGRRSAAEAEIEMMREELTQKSQAARAQSPFSFIINSAKELTSDFYAYLEGNPSVTETFDEFSTPIDNLNFIVRKSKSLIKKEAAGEAVSSIGVGLVDTGHSSIKVQNGIKAFLKKHFNSERGDIFLTEAVLVSDPQNGVEKIIRPSLDLHHSVICMGVPIQYCRILEEPENEIGVLIAAITERRDLINRVFEFFLNAIPPSKAHEARQKMKQRNLKIPTVDTSFKLQLLVDYQDYCAPEKQTRFQHRVESLEKALKKQNAAEAATENSRNEIYLNQISYALKELKPGAKLFYTMGKKHFDDLSKEIDEIDGFIIHNDSPIKKDEV